MIRVDREGSGRTEYITEPDEKLKAITLLTTRTAVYKLVAERLTAKQKR